jgi:tRNA-splicing ligase RtcB
LKACFFSDREALRLIQLVSDTAYSSLQRRFNEIDNPREMAGIAFDGPALDFIAYGEAALWCDRASCPAVFGAGHPDLPEVFKRTGQSVLIGGTMGTASYILAGTKESEELAFSSSCHGAGWAMSRHEALRHWTGRERVSIVDSSCRRVTDDSPEFQIPPQKGRFEIERFTQNGFPLLP